MLNGVRLWALGLGAWGLGAIALLDSSFLTFPQVVDALILVLSARHPSAMVEYAGLSTMGSLVGSLALFMVGRRGGAAFLQRRFSASAVERAGRVYERWGVAALVVAAIAPPPVPFKIFVLFAGAAGMHPATFAAAVGLARGVRYFGEGALAVAYGDDAAALLARHGVEIVVSVAVAVVVALLVWTVIRRRSVSEDETEGDAVARG